MRCGSRSHSQRRERRARPSGCIDGRRCAGERTRTHARRARARRSHHQEQSRLGVRLGSELEKSHPVGKTGRRDMPVETRSRAALAMRDIQAIEESVPRVRDALLTSAKKVAASARSRPTSPVPVSESTTAPVVVGPTETPRRSVARVASDASADVSASDRSTSPILPPTPAIHPSRPRELSLDVPASPRAREDGTRSTPGTPPPIARRASSPRRTSPRRLPARATSTRTPPRTSPRCTSPSSPSPSARSATSASPAYATSTGPSARRRKNRRASRCASYSRSEAARGRWCESSSAIRRCRRSSFE